MHRVDRVVRVAVCLLIVIPSFEPYPTEIIDQIAGLPEGYVPHFLPGTNEQLKEFSDAFGIPFEATRGGKQSTYPEYQVIIKALMSGNAKRSRRN